jgi:hypothetical protein
MSEELDMAAPGGSVMNASGDLPVSERGFLRSDIDLPFLLKRDI